MRPFRNLYRVALALLLGGIIASCAGTGVSRAGAQPLASAPATESPAQRSFTRFCRSWMDKLSARHQQNAKGIAYRKHGDQVVGEYIGYSREPLQCSVTKTGVPGNPFVGKLIYYELRYRQSGQTNQAARRSHPQPLEEVAVMEFFRFDGQRWVY